VRCFNSEDELKTSAAMARPQIPFPTHFWAIQHITASTTAVGSGPRRPKTSDLGDEAEVDLWHVAGPAVVGAERDFPSPVRAAAQADRGVVVKAKSKQALMRHKQPEMESTSSYSVP